MFLEALGGDPERAGPGISMALADNGPGKLRSHGAGIAGLGSSLVRDGLLFLGPLHSISLDVLRSWQRIRGTQSVVCVINVASCPLVIPIGVPTLCVLSGQVAVLTKRGD